MNNAHNSESLNEEYLEALEHFAGGLKRLGTVLDRALEALDRRGVKLSVDLGAMVKTTTTDFTRVQDLSHRVAARLEQVQSLMQATALITSSLDVDVILEEVIDRVIDLTGAERVYLVLRDQTGDGLVTRAARNWDHETLSDEEAMFSRGIVAQVMEQGTAVVASNAQIDPRFRWMDSVTTFALRSVLCVPLTMRGRVVGALYADNRITHGLFNSDVVPLLTALAGHAAVALENAALFERQQAALEDSRRELRRLRGQD